MEKTLKKIDKAVAKIIVDNLLKIDKAVAKIIVDNLFDKNLSVENKIYLGMNVFVLLSSHLELLADFFYEDLKGLKSDNEKIKQLEMLFCALSESVSNIIRTIHNLFDYLEDKPDNEFDKGKND